MEMESRGNSFKRPLNWALVVAAAVQQRAPSTCKAQTPKPVRAIVVDSISVLDVAGCCWMWQYHAKCPATPAITSDQVGHPGPFLPSTHFLQPFNPSRSSRTIVRRWCAGAAAISDLWSIFLFNGLNWKMNYLETAPAETVEISPEGEILCQDVNLESEMQSRIISCLIASALLERNTTNFGFKK